MKVKLVILDIDGVMTDGRKYYGVDGMPLAKTYCDKDFTAIKRLRGAGVHVCFLSGDDTVNEAMSKNRNIDFYYSRGKDKVEFLDIFVKKYNTTPENIAYVGDDLFDQNIMLSVQHPYCPQDACQDIKEICGEENIIPVSAGCNVIMNFVSILLKRNLISKCTMKDIELLDKLEVF